MTPIAEQSPPVSAKEWWSRRRGRYNIGLIKAGLLAFVCYVAVVFWGTSIGAIPDADNNLFTTIFQGVAYLFMMVLANLCYWLGQLSERIIKPTDVDRYRRITFGLGFWLSVLLPFSIPVLLACLCLNVTLSGTPPRSA
jgi:hypothetical protein